MAETLLSIEYNRHDFYPPMPVLRIGVSRSGVRIPVLTIEAIIDTGADGTILPRNVVEKVSASYMDRVYLRGVTGQRQLVDIYTVTLYLGTLPIFGVRVAVFGQGEAIIGRDVLNQLEICLIGPALTTEVQR